jgi:hypothetical protein
MTTGNKLVIGINQDRLEQRLKMKRFMNEKLIKRMKKT